MTVTVDVTETPLNQIAAAVRGRAKALDRGETDIRHDIAHLGSLGLLEAGVEPRPLTELIEVIETVAAESLAAGFGLWAHAMALSYIDRGPESVRAAFRDDLLGGRRIGVTAMAAGMQYAAGLRELALRATAVDGGVLIDGPIRWASNLFDDAVVVFPAAFADGRTVVAAARIGADGITVNPAPNLLALGSTASTSLSFEGVFVPTEHLIATDVAVFCGAIRQRFLLLQTAFCAGITGVALDESASLLTSVNVEFTPDYEQARAAHASLRERLYHYAARTDVTRDELTRLRLDGTEVAVAATRLEAALRGGAGYATGHPTNRRLREAAFLPIQSPAEGQLRWELAQSH